MAGTRCGVEIWGREKLQCHRWVGALFTERRKKEGERTVYWVHTRKAPPPPNH